MPSSAAIPRLFVVDDEASLTRALSTTLSAEGYDARGFTSASAALAELPTSGCELMLVDLMMPEMSGIDLLRAARQIDPSLAGVIMTGEGSVAAAVEAMKAGALDFILKPFNMKTVLPVLSRALELRRLRLDNAALERRVREHAIDLEAANRELEAFSHSVSHDLRTPLITIDGFTAQLQKEGEGLSPRAQDRLRRVRESVKRMALLIDDMLYLSKVTRGQLEREQADLAPLAGEIVAELRARHPEHAVEFVMPTSVPGVCDVRLMRIALANLLENAWKFTGRRVNARIEFSVEQGESEQPVYRIQDNGAGFDMAYASRLFTPFQRLHASDDFPGTGIGLATVLRIVERHGGRLWADAAVDRGASFHFTLGPT